MVALESRNDYVDLMPEGLAAYVSYDKHARSDAFRITRALGTFLADQDVALCFSWYVNTLVGVASPKTARIVRYGNPVKEDAPGRVRTAIAGWSHRSASGVAAVSDGVLREAERTYGSCRGPSVSIPNAVCATGQTGSRPTPEPYIICPARLEPQKDHATLMRAFASVANVLPHTLVIAGEGTLRSDLELEAERLGIASRVKFVGFVPDVERWLRHADLCVLTSKWEGFGSVIIESFSVGTPVLSTDAPYGPREILARVPAGYLTPVGDTKAFAAELVRLLTAPSLLGELGRLAQSEADGTWGASAIARQYERLILKVGAMKTCE